MKLKNGCETQLEVDLSLVMFAESERKGDRDSKRVGDLRECVRKTL